MDRKDRHTFSEGGADNIAPPQAVASLAMAVYALHDSLVAAGVIAPGIVAANLRRLRTADQQMAEFVESVASQLDAMPFRPQTMRDVLKVIDGDGTG